MLVVLVIMSFVMSMVGLRTFNSVDAIRFNQAQKQIESELKLQRAIAVVENQSYVNEDPEGLSAKRDNLRHFKLTEFEGIRIVRDPIIVYSTGVCSPSALRFMSENGRSASVFITTENCKLSTAR